VSTFYKEYKKAGNRKDAILDPQGQLSSLTPHGARRHVPRLVQLLSNKDIGIVNGLVTLEIELRERCAEDYAPMLKQSQALQQSYTGHWRYIQFLRYIQKHLKMIEKDRKALVPETEQLEEEAQPSEEEVHQANEARDEDDEEPDKSEKADEGSLTFAQEEFFFFLGILMTQVEEAAALWTEVKQGKLPIWVAVICK
jgi:hypothetical protein